jgi:hypothetical protein
MSNEKLLSMVNALIDDNSAQAATDFHEFISTKMRNLVNEKEDKEDKAEKIEDKAIDDLKKAQEMEKHAEKKDKK